ncbi:MULTISPECIES: phosphotransferase enzyme family protein [Trichocoleus]|uniref:Phosphotransferase n=1 Tax=Trichocoleus desertorum GB2-A4 TaxID=2933944 RepID=A0ABV0JGU0_9CYAN|nr:phosphotransferase [Trichocoleus sp. FACHB-46]MBD1865559.1 phosphotransferase [Trichocoleus sp. FACHB-46]
MSLSEFTKQAVSEQWSFLAEATFELTAQGSSRAVYFVRASEHQFVLKFYAATTAIAQIHYEHSLLTFLDSAHLPFAIPVPLQTASGETFIAVEVDGQLLNAALLPRLVGHPMERRNLHQIQSAGFALATLHNALAEFDPQGQYAKLPFWGALDRIHPQVSDPFTVPQLLQLGLEEQRHLNQLLNEAIESSPELYATLPIQTIHADYITPNILVNQDQVVGILDFEFATRDLRLLDYMSSLDQLASFPWQEVLFEEIVRAFSTGYQALSLLTLAEMRAAISVWKLQRASSLVYWTGWLVEGKGSRQKIVDAVVETLRFETWLQSNQRKWLDALGCV